MLALYEGWLRCTQTPWNATKWQFWLRYICMTFNVPILYWTLFQILLTVSKKIRYHRVGTVERFLRFSILKCSGAASKLFCASKTKVESFSCIFSRFENKFFARTWHSNRRCDCMYAWQSDVCICRNGIAITIDLATKITQHAFTVFALELKFTSI